jgi:DNA-binding MarR family transcriptional regulator
LSEADRPSAAKVAGPGDVEPDRVMNLLGALGLVIADRIGGAVGEAAEGPETAAAALSYLHNVREEPSIDRLRRVLGLTSSGTVRLVDRLQDAGYVRRRTGGDARSSLIALTASGRRAAKRVAAARSGVLADTLSVLEPDERRELEALISRMLVGSMRGPGAVRWMCRLCDMAGCGRASGRCPVANAARERWGTPD